MTFSTATTNNRSSVLRLTATETAAAEQSVETLKDLFWTLYSKLDAVLQGFRISYEVAMRIAEVRWHVEHRKVVGLLKISCFDSGGILEIQ